MKSNKTKLSVPKDLRNNVLKTLSVGELNQIIGGVQQNYDNAFYTNRAMTSPTISG